MSEDCKTFNCTHCDYKSKWKCNTQRHVVRNHAQQNVTLPQQNVTFPQQNDNITSNELNDTRFMCIDCNKVFNKQWILTRHTKTCSGLTNSLLCINCNKLFASRHSKSRHMKKCNTPLASTINNITNNNINNTTNNTTNNNNTINNNNNNTLNNNTVNIITFQNASTELVPIVPKDVQKIKRLMKCRDTANHKQILDIIRQFVEYSLDVYQNRFVIKNNLRSSYSKVHYGNNNWKHVMDNIILPQFTNIIIGSFQELIPKEKYTFMYDYVDEMYSHGDLQYDSQACRDYAILMNGIRLKLYDLTKDMKFPQNYDNSEISS